MMAEEIEEMNDTKFRDEGSIMFQPKPQGLGDNKFQENNQVNEMNNPFKSGLNQSFMALNKVPTDNIFFFPLGFPSSNFLNDIKRAVEESQKYQKSLKITRYIGKLTEEERKKKIERYLEKKKNRKGKMIRYDIRKNLADQRKRVQGKFVKTKLKNDMLFPLNVTKEETSTVKPNLFGGLTK